MRAQIEGLVGDRVVAAQNCPGGGSAPIIDLLTVLASAAADGIDPDPVLHAQSVATAADPADIDAILAALAGFWLTGALDGGCPAPIAAAKMKLGRGALGWLVGRLGVPGSVHQ